MAVLATHANDALAVLESPTSGESGLLGAIPYSRNPAVLHSQPGLLPRARRARSSWNYLMPSCRATSDAVVVTYDMGRLQSLPTTVPQLVSLNARGRIDPDRVTATMSYMHPVFTPQSVAASRLLSTLNDGTIAYAGAHHGWGFHEDGCRAGAQAAESLGVPW